MLEMGFPSFLIEEVNEVLKIIPTKTFNKNILLEPVGTYAINGIEINLPYRIYFNEPLNESDINKLSNRQKMILHCIYTRSCDGFVRERHIKSLLCMDYEDWVIPYIIKVCDEYVIEILEIVYLMLNEFDIKRFKAVCLENKETFNKSYCRMMSYWNEYYRRKYPNFEEYIGSKLFKKCFGYAQMSKRNSIG